ncbi:MAG TPA: hypothetical protein VFY71_14010 [Planctomycetota bacterium]|nr:hypothetical protein [Planctomycetota bacterium]
MVSDRDRRQIEAVKALGRRWAGDPVQLRLVVAVAILALGIGVVQHPLGTRLAAARTAHDEALKQARLADDQRFLATQAAGYEKRVAISSDLVDWQNYVLERFRTTSATLISLEPKATTQKPPFDVLEMELVAKGTNYADFVDFIDRLEHGERLVRIEKLRIERQQTSVYVTLVIKGLVRAGGKSGAEAGKTSKKGKTASATEGDAANAPPAAPEGDAPAMDEPPLASEDAAASEDSAPSDDSAPPADTAPDDASEDGGRR